VGGEEREEEEGEEEEGEEREAASLYRSTPRT
jgi:hypothetical protein